MWPPMRTARSDSPASVNHWFPAASIDSSAPVLATSPRSHSRARSQVSVQATRCAPVLVAGELAQLLQLGDRALRIEARGHRDRL